jgi:Delta7-sterol 5-desaturase
MSLELQVCTLILTIIPYLFVVGVERFVRRRPMKPVIRVTEPPGQRAREMKNSWLTTPIHAALFFTLTAGGALHTAPETPGLAAGTFLLTFMWTEAWHYASHAAMHTKALHFIHKEHHRSRVTEPWTSVSFSVIEKLIFSLGILGFLALVSCWRELSLYGIFAYYLLYFFTNTLGHANVEFRRPGYYTRAIARFFNSPTYHALHHARYIKNYGLITPWLDRLFGTEWPDVPEVQTRAASGEPLTRLSERVALDPTRIHPPPADQR